MSTNHIQSSLHEITNNIISKHSQGPRSPHDWRSGPICLEEQLVPVWQKSITLADCLPDECCVLWAKEPGFPACGVQMSMSAEEWLIRTRLIPANQKLSAGILKKATNISCMQEERNGQQHDYKIQACKVAHMSTVLCVIFIQQTILIIQFSIHCVIDIRCFAQFDSAFGYKLNHNDYFTVLKHIFPSKSAKK